MEIVYRPLQLAEQNNYSLRCNTILPNAKQCMRKVVVAEEHAQDKITQYFCSEHGLIRKKQALDASKNEAGAYGLRPEHQEELQQNRSLQETTIENNTQTIKTE